MSEIADWILSPPGLITAGAVTIGSGILAFGKKICKLAVKLLSPMMRSLLKEPQRLESRIFINPDDTNGLGLLIKGELKRNESNPIIYPNILLSCSDASIKVGNLLNLPMSGESLEYDIYRIKFDEIDSIQKGAVITAKVNYVNDLVEAKCNVAELQLDRSIEDLRNHTLSEIKQVLIERFLISSKISDSFKTVRRKFIEESSSNREAYEFLEKTIPKDEFRFYLNLFAILIDVDNAEAVANRRAEILKNKQQVD